jgi:transcriptional regulator with XRE-family HTH domain
MTENTVRRKPPITVTTEHFQKRRKELGMSRREAARNVGVHASHLANIERGEEVPSYNLLVRLADLYEVPVVDYLLYRAQRKNDVDLFGWLRSVTRNANPSPNDGDVEAKSAKPKA